MNFHKGADLDHHVIAAKLLAMGTRVAPCGVLCPGGLPCPWPGRFAHQGGLTGREGGVLGIAWMSALGPDSGPSLVVESRSWMSVLF
jgi:hypothetical protein